MLDISYLRAISREKRFVSLAGLVANVNAELFVSTRGKQKRPATLYDFSCFTLIQEKNELASLRIERMEGTEKTELDVVIPLH